MKDLIIIGSSGFGIEVAFLAKRAGFNVIGYLDDTPEKKGTNVLGVPVLGGVSEWEKYTNYKFIIAIGSPRARESVYQKMKSDHVSPQFATLIDPAAIIGEFVHLGAGSIVCAGVIITANVHIGCNVIINLNSTIGHDCVIEDFVTIAPQAAISGNVELKKLVEVGTAAALREKLSVGAGSIVGMGSVLTKSVDACVVVVGNPARAIKKMER